MAKPIDLNNIAISKSVRDIADEGRAIVKELMMTSLSKINLTTDIWTKKGLTSSYLGITGHFCVEEDSVEEGKHVKV